MRSSFTRKFADPDEFCTSIGKAEIFIRQPGSFAAKHSFIDLHRLRVQRFSVILPQLIRVDIIEPRVDMVFLTDAGPGAVRDGVELGSAKISGFRNDDGYFHQTFGPVKIANISLLPDDFASLVETLVGRAPALSNWSFTPLPDQMARLRRLLMAASHLMEYAPAVLAEPEAARGFEQALTEAMIHCLDGGESREDRAAERHHAAIMRRFDRVIEEHLDEPLYVPELCREVGASARTLLACCQEHLGMGPKHYLLLRRMHMVRRTLRKSAPADTTVTEVAMRYGFWQLGRFAGEYRALFGESPSDTLVE